MLQGSTRVHKITVQYTLNSHVGYFSHTVCPSLLASLATLLSRSVLWPLMCTHTCTHQVVTDCILRRATNSSPAPISSAASGSMSQTSNPTLAADVSNCSSNCPSNCSTALFTSRLIRCVIGGAGVSSVTTCFLLAFPAPADFDLGEQFLILSHQSTIRPHPPLHCEGL